MEHLRRQLILEIQLIKALSDIYNIARANIYQGNVKNPTLDAISKIAESTLESIPE